MCLFACEFTFLHVTILRESLIGFESRLMIMDLAQRQTFWCKTVTHGCANTCRDICQGKETKFRSSCKTLRRFEMKSSTLASQAPRLGGTWAEITLCPAKSHIWLCPGAPPGLFRNFGFVLILIGNLFENSFFRY